MKNSEDKQALIQNLSGMLDALASVIGQNIEVVLHDLSQPQASVIKIINGHISGRKPGSALQDGPENDLGFLGLLGKDQNDTSAPSVFKDYRTTSGRGTPLRSATVLYKDESGKPAVSVCFNADYQLIDGAREALAQLMPAQVALAGSDNHSDLEERMNEIIRAALPPGGVLRTGASKKEKVESVRLLQEKGLFIVRGGVERAASALGVTRYTIYNYLDEIKKERAKA